MCDKQKADEENLTTLKVDNVIKLNGNFNVNLNKFKLFGEN